MKKFERPLTIILSIAAGLTFAAGVDAQELSGGECLAAASGSSSRYIAGWFHNSPPATRRQDGVWPSAPSGGVSYWDSPRDANPLGADVTVVANYAADEIVGSGLVSATEPGTTRFNYAGVNGAGSTFAQAVMNNDYLQYQFTTPASLDPRTYFSLTGFGAWNSEAYRYSVRVSTSPAFTTYWTLVENQAVVGGGGSSYNFRPAGTSRFPLLRKNTTYYIRVYVYNRTVNLGTASSQPNSVSLDDFQIGTAVCPASTVQLQKNWAPNSLTGDRVSIGSATVGGVALTTSFSATAPIAANSGTPVAANIGDVINLPAEGGQNLGNYNTSISCSGGHRLSGTNGKEPNTLTINSINPAVCTYTNSINIADLHITKTNTPQGGAIDQPNDMLTSGSTTTYQLKVMNVGPAIVSGAIVRDAPGSELDCPSFNPVTCIGSGCPVSGQNIETLSNGFAMGTLAAGQSATFSFTCNVR